MQLRERSDQSVPVMGGLQAVAAMRTMRADRPMLFLSGDGEAPATDSGGNPLRVDSLCEPIDLDSMLRAVEWVRRKRLHQCGIGGKVLGRRGAGALEGNSTLAHV